MNLLMNVSVLVKSLELVLIFRLFFCAQFPHTAFLKILFDI